VLVAQAAVGKKKWVRRQRKGELKKNNQTDHDDLTLLHVSIIASSLNKSSINGIRAASVTKQQF